MRDPQPLFGASCTSGRAIRPQLDLELPHQERVLAAATIKAEHAMAYADAFAAATAVAHQAPLLTGDAELLLPSAPWTPATHGWI